MRTMQIAVKFKSWMQAVAAVTLVVLLAACGGGGSGDNSSSSSNSPSTLNGGSLPASPTQQPTDSTAANTVPITVNQGLSGVVNIPSVSVKICASGSTSNCQTIDNIQLDTGSFGLRIVGSALNSAVLQSLPVSKLSNGASLAECATFADGFTWGTVRNATVTIGGETTASAIPLQIIGDTTAGAMPARGCGIGSAENTVSDLGANGILGIGTAQVDCGSTCANLSTAATYSNYFGCPSITSCARTAVSIPQQVANPAAKFQADNNGVIVQMPPLPDSGAPSASGTLVFGIGTQSNNTLSNVQSFTTDGYGNLNNSSFNGSTVQAFLDSGSNAYFFGDSSLPACGSSFADFYCPTSAQTRSVTLVGLNKATTSASIGIQNAATLFGNTSNYAFNNLAGQIGGNSNFDLGLPFFYGRHVYYGFDQTATGGPAPFVAF
jgi:Protein of unknown function (DUF3443)